MGGINSISSTAVPCGGYGSFSTNLHLPRFMVIHLLRGLSVRPPFTKICTFLILSTSTLPIISQADAIVSYMILTGIALALQKCERVNVYEYIPSVRESARCHYYGPKNESNPSCTYGSWHPVSAEKLFFLGLTDSTDKQIFMDGVLSIPGVSKFKC